MRPRRALPAMRNPCSEILAWLVCLTLTAALSAPAAAQPEQPADPPSEPTPTEPREDADSGATDADPASAPDTGEPTDSAPPERITADTAAAEALFQLGKALMDSGKVDEACDKFAASMRAEPAGGTLLNLALCHQVQGKTASAWAEYRKAADLIRAAGQVERADEAMRLAVDLEPKLSKLTISVPQPVPGLRIVRSGVPIARGAWGVNMPINPAEYRIEASAPGYRSWSTTLVVGADADRKAVAIPALERLPTPATSDKPTDPASSAPGGDYRVPYITGIIMAAAGGTAVGVGAILGGLAAGDVNDAEADEALCGADKRCTPEGDEVIEGARAKATAATLLIGVGAATVVSGVVLLLTTGTYRADAGEPADQATAASRLVPAVGPGSAGVVISGSF